MTCLEYLESGFVEDGVYNLSIFTGADVVSFKAVCDMGGGGFTLIQQYVSQSQDLVMSGVRV